MGSFESPLKKLTGVVVACYIIIMSPQCASISYIYAIRLDGRLILHVSACRKILQLRYVRKMFLCSFSFLFISSAKICSSTISADEDFFHRHNNMSQL